MTQSYTTTWQKREENGENEANEETYQRIIFQLLPPHPTRNHKSFRQRRDAQYGNSMRDMVMPSLSNYGRS
ncbi:hypothetical protein BCON_0068g00150 [Botryotinia convoluta]|uniref:Uncharacterized protein n=1 Tax=Botryotinia convoluta TaxID=54673 RepID=A0A4Z1I931_9HELO|nr:hypothetical protein BCON_0068g00150 [Botryotinia convoluta]